MGFSEEMERIEAERISAVARSNADSDALARHSSSVIREIERSLPQAVEMLRKRAPQSAGYLVAQEIIQVPQKRGFFGKVGPAVKRADGYLAGRYWPMDVGCILTDGCQILKASPYHRSRGDSIMPETEALARSLGVPENTDVAVTAKGNEAPRLLDGAHLVLATREHWKGPTEGVGNRWWACTTREPFAALLDTEDWAPRGIGFGITPDGEAGLVSVQEKEPWGDGASFRMVIYQLDKWLASFVQRAIKGE